MASLRYGCLSYNGDIASLYSIMLCSNNKQPFDFSVITYENVDRFSKFFYWQDSQENSLPIVDKNITTHLLHCCTTLWNMKQILWVWYITFPAQHGSDTSSTGDHPSAEANDVGLKSKSVAAPNSPNLNPVDYAVWGRIRQHCVYFVWKFLSQINRVFMGMKAWKGFEYRSAFTHVMIKNQKNCFLIKTQGICYPQLT